MLTRDDLIRAATILWGDPTKTTRRGMRFGTHGSKKIEFDGLVWSDFEAGEYGGIVELCQRAGNTENLGNGSDTNEWHIPFTYKGRKKEFLFQVVKRPNRPRHERFIQRRMGPDGEWIYNLDGVERVPYHLPQLIEADPAALVFLCEGEKDVRNVEKLGLIATTNPGGAGKWREEYNEFLADLDIVILPDNDEAGETHVKVLLDKLKGVHSITVVRLPGLGLGEDVSDWIERGGTKEQLLALVAENASGASHSTILPLHSYADLEGLTFMPLQWIVPDYIPEGVTLLAGKPKIGKSWLALAITMACAEGSIVLDQRCARRDVIYFALEDTQRRMQSRTEKLLGRNSGWPKNAWSVYELPPLDKGGIERLHEYAKQVPSLGLIIIDTLVKIRGPKKKDEDQYAADHRTMSALLDFSHKTGIAVVVIHHVRKQTAEDIFDTISGTLGLNGGADTLVVLTKTKDDQLRLAVRGRDLEEQDKTVFFDVDMGSWGVTGDYAADDDVALSSKTVVISCLQAAGSAGMTPSDVSKKTGLPDTNVKQMLRRMAKSGKIRKTQYGTYSI